MGKSKTKNKEKVTIRSKNYGELDGVTIYLTGDLQKRLQDEKWNNTPVMKLLEMGRALPGLKHLITTINRANPHGNLVLCLDETGKEGNEYFINYDEYRKISKARFFPIYQERGLDTAQFYLNKYFPKEFAYEPIQLRTSEVKRIQGQLPEVLKKLSEKERPQVALLQEANRIMRSKLRKKNRAYKDAVQGLRIASNLEAYQLSLDELKLRLSSGKVFRETSGKNSWQNWIHANNWLFGIQHLRPISKEQVGFKNIPDFLFPTSDGFLDILEIKTPKPDVIRKDDNHSGSYIWCPETNIAIGQAVTYVQEMEDHRLEIRDNINNSYGAEYGMVFHVVKPRAFVLVGKSEDWASKEKEAFRRLNYSLHGIEVITYSELVKRGESIIAMLNASPVYQTQ